MKKREKLKPTADIEEYLGGKHKEFDRFTKSKAILALAYGVVICIPVALVLEVLLVFALLTFNLPLYFISAVIIAPVVEESLKMAPILGERRQTSIILLAFFIALGFGFMELVWHTISGAIFFGEKVFVLSITPIIHIICTVSGAWVYSINSSVRQFIFGLTAATIIHAFYNLVVITI